jgi:branched-chain amino acid transport system permease protein
MMHEPAARIVRWRRWEPVVWVLAFAAPWLLSATHCIVNEIAIVALFALSLDLILGYTALCLWGMRRFFGFWRLLGRPVCQARDARSAGRLLVGMAPPPRSGACVR